jgi:hypothetical protein
VTESSKFEQIKRPFVRPFEDNFPKFSEINSLPTQPLNISKTMYSPPVMEPDFKNEKSPGLPTETETITPEVKDEGQQTLKQEIKQEPDVITPKKLKKSLLSDYSKLTKKLDKSTENTNNHLLHKQVLSKYSKMKE